MKNSLWKLLCVCALSFAACSKNDPAPLPLETDEDLLIVDDHQNLNFEIGWEGGSVAVRFTAKSAWTAAVPDTSPAAEWVTVEPKSGTAGNYTLTITAAPNEEEEERAGEVQVKSGSSVLIVKLVQHKCEKQPEPEDEPEDEPYITDMETAFPDPIFRAYVLENIDTDGDGILSEEEAAAVTKIDVSNEMNTPDEERIASLKGVEYFPNLTELNCNYNKLTALDVTQNPALETLYCSWNQLPSLNMMQNPALCMLDCCWNQLTDLDVTQNPALTDLCCYSNQLTRLDVTQNPALDYLLCDSNQLTDLDVTQNPELNWLSCKSNQLTDLDVTQNPALETLYCSCNQLTDLDVTQNPALKFLYCDSNQLTDLDVTQNMALTQLECYSNRLTNLDVTQNPALEYLDCQSNQLTDLDMSQNSALDDLSCGGNQLTSLDLSKTNLGNSSNVFPLKCAPMETLDVLYLKAGWSIAGITTDRSTWYIPEQTEIVFVD